MKEKKYNFVYLSKNLISGKLYVGDHSAEDLENTKTKNYLGSGTYIKRAIKKYGKNSFKREILEFFPSKQEAFNAQAKYINKYNTLFPIGYNISPIGGYWGQYISEESKQKMRKPKSKEHKEHLSLAWIERRKIPVSKETREKNGKAQLGKTRKQECKDKIGYANTIRIWKDESRQNLRNKKLGTHLSEETKKLIGKKSLCKYCSKEMNAGNLARYHNENCKFKLISVS